MVFGNVVPLTVTVAHGEIRGILKRIIRPLMPMKSGQLCCLRLSKFVVAKVCISAVPALFNWVVAVTATAAVRFDVRLVVVALSPLLSASFFLHDWIPKNTIAIKAAIIILLFIDDVFFNETLFLISEYNTGINRFTLKDYLKFLKYRKLIGNIISNYLCKHYLITYKVMISIRDNAENTVSIL